MLKRLALSLLALCCVTLPVHATDRDVLIFIEQMMHGVEAELIVCPMDVLRDVRTHDMNAVCATFNGDFEQFEWRWTLSLLRESFADQQETGGVLPRTEPQSSWEIHEGNHERIYAVGEDVVGVRFSEGDVIIVYMRPQIHPTAR